MALKGASFASEIRYLLDYQRYFLVVDQHFRIRILLLKWSSLG